MRLKTIPARSDIGSFLTSAGLVPRAPPGHLLVPRSRLVVPGSIALPEVIKDQSHSEVNPAQGFE